jgi:hypothetical protein
MSGHPFYDTRDWRDRIRPRQLARHPMCQWPECDRPADTVDHIQPINQGGAKRDPANFQSLCSDHHQVKRAAERHGKDWRKEAWRGCYEDGSPRDPSHPWYTGGGSITAKPGVATAGGKETE